MAWLLYNNNTTNFKHHFFHMLFSALLKSFFTPFPSVQPSQAYFTKTCEAYFTKALHQGYKLNNYLTIVTNNFVIPRKFTN